MPEILSNICDNCDKHLSQMHRTLQPVCDRCLPADIVLRTCGGCHELRYCGTKCQREHWKRGHKADCAELQYNVELSERYGPLVAAHRKRVLRWTKKHQHITNLAANYAVGVGSNEDLSRTHCFLITVKATSTKPDLSSPVSVISADVVPDAEIRNFFVGIIDTTKVLIKESNYVKLVIFDPDLPRELGLVHMQVGAPDMPLTRQAMGNTRFDWKAWLHASLAKGKPLVLNDFLILNDPRQKLRYDSLVAWYGTHEEQFSMAAFSALNLRRSASKLRTHALRVDVTARSGRQVPYEFKVRSAKLMSFAEMGNAVPDTAKQGFIHTLIVDDGLPEMLSFFTIALDTKNHSVQGMYQHRDNWLRHLRGVVDQH